MTDAVIDSLSAKVNVTPAARTAWIVIGNQREARAIAQALPQAGWHVTAVAHGLATFRDLMRGGSLPDVVVCGLRFDDGDGLQLIRLLGGRAKRPAVFIASHQQRAVIKSAAALAAACGVPVAGLTEQPVDGEAIAQSLNRYQPPRGTPRPLSPPQPLSREELQSMFDRGALVPWMQPKVRLSSREVVAFEALMRAHDAQGRLVTPDRLIGALADHGLLDQATMRMARQTVDFVGECLSRGLAISASINVAMQSLANLDFCRELADAVETLQVDPSWITIEITETDAMSDLAQVIENTARIRMLGFNLAIDDFGTAYSSFFQLSRIPFSELKIERAFTRNLQNEPDNQAIVRACAQLGSALGLHVVAEGVETTEELAWVHRCGCTQIQGYHVARPMPVPAAMHWLEELQDLQVPLAV